jgi:CheY-like chemotaxis protein
LTFSKGGNPIKKTVAVGRLIHESAVFVLSGSNVKCEFSIPDDLPPADIDEGQVSQVINNLLINARQAMPSGGIINISIEKKSVGKTSLPLKPGVYLFIAVKDHGTGISKENLTKIFDPFFTTKPKGNGLGLSSSYSIIQKHGGCLTAESEEGKGATFYIYLPASGNVPAEEINVSSSSFTSKKKVLLMDDEELILQVGTQMLNHLGLEVERARDGKEAIDLFTKAKNAGSPFDIVIMDLTIPAGMGGKETVVELLKIDPAVKAIVSSGYSTDPVISSFRSYGFSGFIIKPYKIEDLTSTLTPLL